MNLKRLLGVAAVLLIIWFIVTQPAAAASTVDSIAATLGQWATNITSFFTAVVT